MILRFWENQNFLKKFLNGPIRKVIMSKVKFEDLRLPLVLAIPDLVIFRPKSRNFQDSPRVLMNPAPSVRQSVSDKSSHTSHHQFFLIFCIKLAFNKSRKVTFSDFRKKNVLAQKWAIWAQNGPNLGFLAIFSISNHQIFAILQIMIDNYDIYQLLVFIVLEKNIWA